MNGDNNDSIRSKGMPISSRGGIVLAAFSDPASVVLRKITDSFYNAIGFYYNNDNMVLFDFYTGEIIPWATTEYSLNRLTTHEDFSFALSYPIIGVSEEKLRIKIFQSIAPRSQTPDKSEVYAEILHSVVKREKCLYVGLHRVTTVLSKLSDMDVKSLDDISRCPILSPPISHDSQPRICKGIPKDRGSSSLEILCQKFVSLMNFDTGFRKTVEEYKIEGNGYVSSNSLLRLREELQNIIRDANKEAPIQIDLYRIVSLYNIVIQGSCLPPLALDTTTATNHYAIVTINPEESTGDGLPKVIAMYNNDLSRLPKEELQELYYYLGSLSEVDQRYTSLCNQVVALIADRQHDS